MQEARQAEGLPSSLCRRYASMCRNDGGASWRGNSASCTTHLVVYLQVGRSDQVLAASGCVALYTCEDVFHSPRNDPPLGPFPFSLHGECLSSPCLPICNDGGIVSLQSGLRSGAHGERSACHRDMPSGWKCVRYWCLNGPVNPDHSRDTTRDTTGMTALSALRIAYRTFHAPYNIRMMHSIARCMHASGACLKR